MKHFHHYDTIIIKWNVLFADNKTNYTNKPQLKMGIRVNENGDKAPKVKVLKWCVLVATVHLINPCSYIFIYWLSIQFVLFYYLYFIPSPTQGLSNFWVKYNSFLLNQKFDTIIATKCFLWIYLNKFPSSPFYCIYLFIIFYLLL